LFPERGASTLEQRAICARCNPGRSDRAASAVLQVVNEITNVARLRKTYFSDLVYRIGGGFLE
jgi:hypothetical protein